MLLDLGERAVAGHRLSVAEHDPLGQRGIGEPLGHDELPGRGQLVGPPRCVPGPRTVGWHLQPAPAEQETIVR